MTNTQITIVINSNLNLVENKIQEYECTSIHVLLCLLKKIFTGKARFLLHKKYLQLLFKQL